MIKRRDIFKIGVVAGVALAVPAQRLAASAAGVVPPVEAFTVPLPIPPVLDPVFSDEHGDHYELAVMPGTARILPGVDTRMLTYNGVFPGLTIKAVRGWPARVTVTNRVATPTAVHLHGGEVPQDSDGHPLDVIRPGGSRIYRYPNHQPAASLWYHDHAHHLEAEQIYRGLSGFDGRSDGFLPPLRPGRGQCLTTVHRPTLCLRAKARPDIPAPGVPADRRVELYPRRRWQRCSSARAHEAAHRKGSPAVTSHRRNHPGAAIAQLISLHRRGRFQRSTVSELSMM